MTEQAEKVQPLENTLPDSQLEFTVKNGVYSLKHQEGIDKVGTQQGNFQPEIEIGYENHLKTFKILHEKASYSVVKVEANQIKVEKNTFYQGENNTFIVNENHIEVEHVKDGKVKVTINKVPQTVSYDTPIELDNDDKITVMKANEQPPRILYTQKMTAKLTSLD